VQGTALNEILHTIGQGIFVPCLVVLLLMIVITIFQVGNLVVELLVERRRMKEDVPKLLKLIDSADLTTALRLVETSRLLKRQKRMIAKLTGADDMEENPLAAYAQKLLSAEDAHYRLLLAPTDLIAKLGPMFGLLCTLIPLGPGIVALGKGDIQALSASIGIAFDGTIVGVISAAVCFSISYLRTHWYEGYASTNEALAEAFVDKLVERKGTHR
jgi:biopolymer transport protein ExbB/TolQ